MIQIDTQANEGPLSGAFADIYQQMAKKRLSLELKRLKDTPLFSDLIAKTGTIRSYEDLQRFVKDLPLPQQTADLIAAGIKQEYDANASQIEEIKKEREIAASAAKVDTTQLGRMVVDRLQLALPGEYETPYGLENGELPSFRRRAALQGVRSLDRIMGAPDVRGFRQGDIVTIAQMTGIDLDTFEPQYFYGGNTDEMPLGTQAEVISAQPEVLRLRIYEDGAPRKDGVNDTVWSVHPDEAKTLGRNTYQELIQQAGTKTKAALRIIDRAIAEAEPALLEEEKARIRATFDGRIRTALTALRAKYDLTDHALDALAQGKTPHVQVTDYDGQQVKFPFNTAAEVAQAFLAHKTGRRTNWPKEIRDEQQFRAAMVAAVKQAKQTNPEGLADDMIKWMGAMLSTEHYLVGRELLVKNPQADVMQTVLQRLAQPDDGAWARRLFLYNDRSIYKGGHPFAPPSENLTRVLLLEAGNGCNYAKCTFCTEYAKADFFVRKPQEFDEHTAKVIERLDSDSHTIQRAFIAGGNSLELPTKMLQEYLNTIRKRVTPVSFYRGGRLRRVGIFGRTEGILKKSVEELRELEGNNLQLVYWGVETGAQEVLDWVNKGITRKEMDEAGKKITQTDMMLSLMIMPGLGGMRFYDKHVEKTTEILNALRPRYITFHTVTPKPGTRYIDVMAEEQKAGINRPLTEAEVVEQMHDIVSGLNERNWNRDHPCLCATYYPPAAKIAINPVQFRGYLHRGDKPDILGTLQGWFREDPSRAPSQDLQDRNYNRNSPLRKMARNVRQ